MDNELKQHQQTATIPQRLHPIDLRHQSMKAMEMQNLKRDVVQKDRSAAS